MKKLFSDILKKIVATAQFHLEKGILILLISGLFFRCHSDEPITPSPSISSFTPVYGLPGTTVTIIGTNFNSTPENNSVEFNQVSATVTSATPTQLTVTVPASAATGKIKVTTAGINAESTDDFDVTIDIPRTGLVAFYPFSGNANDVSGNNLNGTVISASPGTDRFGNANKAYSFDGAVDYITMGNPAALQLNNYVTVACWINMDTFKDEDIITKFGITPNGIGGNDTKTGYAIGRVLGEPFSVSVNHQSFQAFGAIVQGHWVFVALVLDGFSWRFYHFWGDSSDKNNRTNFTGTTMLDGALGDLNIGGSPGGGLHFDGLIDDVTIYNRPLSDNEVRQLYLQTITRH